MKTKQLLVSYLHSTAVTDDLVLRLDILFRYIAGPPESRPETKYEQPIYKVRVGEFGDRLEAQATYAELLEEFPDAAVIPSRIKIN